LTNTAIAIAASGHACRNRAGSVPGTSFSSEVAMLSRSHPGLVLCRNPNGAQTRLGSGEWLRDATMEALPRSKQTMRSLIASIAIAD